MFGDYKIVFTGPTGAGKTTAVAAISDTPPLVTDVPDTDPASRKALTTVGLDYGQITLPGGEVVRLFGTPGQARFDFLWRILSRNALGLVILIDHSRPDPHGDLATYLDGFRQLVTDFACVIGVGRLEAGHGAELDDYAEWLAARGLLVPVLAVDVRRRDDVLLLVDAVLAQVDATGAVQP